MDVAAHVEVKARAAKEAARVLALAPTRAKNEALAQMARGLEERTAAMVSNLMVVLCGEQPPSPVVNAGTLYS